MSIFKILFWPFKKHSTAVEHLSVAEHASPNAGFTLEQYENFSPVARIKWNEVNVEYFTPNQATKWRVDTLFSKEPDTITWLSELMPSDVLIDIGANVGMYTILAGKCQGCRVFAFEPESQNYGILNKNIWLNSISDSTKAYCLALSDESKFSELYLSQFHAGGSCHTFGEKLDFKLEFRESSFSQGCFSVTLDSLVESGAIPQPTHIKIDVDGLEHRVIKGAIRTIGNPVLRSVLIEINTNLPEHREVISSMESLGFKYDAEQVERYKRKEGTFVGVGNYVFRR